jgi:hypothetical protein
MDLPPYLSAFSDGINSILTKSDEPTALKIDLFKRFRILLFFAIESLSYLYKSLKLFKLESERNNSNGTVRI